MLPSNLTDKKIHRLIQDALQLYRRDANLAFTLANQAVALLRSRAEPPAPKLLGDALRARAMAQGTVGKIEPAKADFTEALALARDAEEIELESQCLHGISVALFHLGDSALALERMSEAIALRRVVNDPIGLRLSLNSLAAFHGSLGNYSDAITCLTEARALTDSSTDSTDEAVILTNLALVYVELGQPEEAISFFEEAILLYESAPDDSNRCNTLLNYANTLRALGRTQDALAVAQDALTLAQQLEHPFLEVKTMAILGSIPQPIAQAEELLQRALQLAQERQLAEPLAMVQQSFGGFYLKQGRLEKAAVLLEQALAWASAKRQRFTQSELHKMLCAVCEAQGEFQKALEHYREYHHLYDHLHRESANHRLRNQRAHYEAVHARLEAEELRRQALEDPLTQLYNRRYLSQYLESEITRSRRHKLPLSLILIDIDNFKAVNDNFSHRMGDQVLLTLGLLLRQVSRGSDILARQAGDEFVIVTPETPLADAHLMAERIQQAIQVFDWESLAPGLKVTISIGIADLLTDNNLLDRADERLYEAKRAGKNRLVS